MNNALDYLEWRGDLDFRISPINDVDIFLCSQLATPDYTGIVADQPVPVKTVSEAYFDTREDRLETLGVLQSPCVHPMLHRLPNVRRFEELRLCHYRSRADPSNAEQFSAVTVLFPTGEICVSFRGTDDTIIGWKEDFNLAVMESVPAQRDALEYLSRAALHFPGSSIYVCGHSKGGNLSTYAAVMAGENVRERIVRAYNFDGPGFTDAFTQSREYARMKDRIVTIISNESLVGLLLNRVGIVKIVRSDVTGPRAHDGFNWEVKGTSFLRRNELSDFSATFEKAMAATLAGMTGEEKTAFINELFDTLLSTGAVTCTEFTGLGMAAIFSLLTDFNGMQKTRAFLATLMETYIRIYHRTSMDGIERSVKEYREKSRSAGIGQILSSAAENLKENPLRDLFVKK